MKYACLFFLMFCSAQTLAQRVELMVEGRRVELPVVLTQSDTRPGWKIVDIQLKDRQTRFLWGSHSTQLTDDARPVFVIEPGDKETLYDYALILLENKKEYRRFPRFMPKDNAYIRITPDSFAMRAEADAFVCQPLKPLPSGDYFLLNLEQQPIGKPSNYQGYAFQVK